MDHLGFPAEYQSRLPQIPHLAKAPKYDYLGFDGFPERHGVNSQDLLNISKENISSPDSAHPLRGCDPLFIQSLLQEWLWFGTMHEFELACSRPMNRNNLVEKDSSSDGNILSTKSLLPYVNEVVVSRLLQAGVPLNLKIGDLVHYCDPDSLLPDGSFSKTFLARVTSTGADGLVTVDPTPEQSPTISIAYVRRSSNNKCEESISSPECQTELSLMVLCEVIYQIKVMYDDMEESHRSSSSQSSFERSTSIFTDNFKPPARLVARDRPQQNIRSMLDRTATFDFLRKAEQITDRLSRIDESVLSFELLLSFDILLCSLNTACSFIYGQFGKYPRESSFYKSRFTATMRQNGWCPSRIWPMCSGRSLIQTYLASMLPSYETQIHPDSCTTVKCAKRPDKLGDIETQHQGSCNKSCRHISISSEKLIEILKTGGNPALRLIGRTSDELATYEVVDTRGHEFVAISHVWSHGLGNPSQNALPQCQLEYLFKAIGELLPGDPLLWIDIMSVPIDSSWKTVAISRLKQVYREAERVLVIDKHLKEVGEGHIERQIQILGSEWMKRLWTLQEGRLASNLYFQFRTEAVSLSRLTTDLSQLQNGDYYDIFTAISQRSSLRLQNRLEPKYQSLSQFLMLTDEIGHRSVTEPDDEPICLATLLSLDLEKFQTSLPTMTDIYQNISEIPQGIIFSARNRLQIPGFRWAPASFIESGSLRIIWSPENSLPGCLYYPYGLIVNYDCIIVDHPLEFRYPASPSHEVIYLRNPKASGILAFRCDNSEPGFEISKSWEREAIILAESVDEFETTTSAVLVHSVRWDSGLMYCNYGFPGNVWHVNSQTADWSPEVLGYTTPENPYKKAKYHDSLEICID